MYRMRGSLSVAQPGDAATGARKSGFRFSAPLLFASQSTTSLRGHIVEHSSPLGTLWAGLGLGAFYLALMWVNILLGHFLTPLFLIPLTWIQDAVQGKKA